MTSEQEKLANNFRNYTTKLFPFYGSCGATELANIPRQSLDEVVAFTEVLKEQCKYPGVIITTCKALTAEQESWLAQAGWIKSVEYQGQYTAGVAGVYEQSVLNKDKRYPMTLWSLVIKPFIRDMEVV